MENCKSYYRRKSDISLYVSEVAFFTLPLLFLYILGTPVNRIPIMAKQVLDLYCLFNLVTEKGGLVEVINKKQWREITKGLNLPASITSAAFTLRTQ